MKKWFIKNWSSIVFICILIIAFIPRSIEVFSGNYLFGFDQGLFYEDVRKIVVDKKITLIGAEVGGIGGFFQGPGWNYFLAIPFILFNGDPYGGMIFMLLLGISSIFGSFFLFRKHLGVITALLIAFFVATSPGMISQSRFIWPPFVIPPLTILFSYFVLNSAKRPTVYIPCAFGIIGLMTHFEIATGITFFASSLFAFLLFYRKELLKIKTILYSFIVLISTQATLIVFDLRHNFISSRGILNLFLHNKTNTSTYSFQNHIDIFKDAFLGVSFNLPLFFTTLIVALYFGHKLLKDKKSARKIKTFLLFVVVNPILLFIIFLPLKMSLWAWWVLEVSIFTCIFFAITFSYGLKNKTGRIVIIFLLVIYFYFYAVNAINWIKNDFPDYGGTAKIKGKMDAIDYIYKDANGEKFSLFVFTPPIYTYPFDYLIHWYANEKYGYMPDNKKEGVFYLLMETDPSKPKSHIGWMETVIIEGKTVKEIKLPSGFIVQKRVSNKDKKE